MMRIRFMANNPAVIIIIWSNMEFVTILQKERKFKKFLKGVNLKKSLLVL